MITTEMILSHSAKLKTEKMEKIILKVRTSENIDSTVRIHRLMVRTRATTTIQIESKWLGPESKSRTELWTENKARPQSRAEILRAFSTELLSA